MSSRVNVALAGIGGYGELYVDSLLHNPHAANANLVAVADPMPQRSRRLAEVQGAGIPIHASLADLFERHPRLDLLMIATPIHLHCPQTCLALQRGVNVLCEKPLAGTVHEALTMLEAQHCSPDVFCGIGYQWSFSEAVQSLKRDILSGLLGRALRMKSIVFFPRPTSYFRRNDWAGRIRTAAGEAVYDSPANNATSHYLHNMLYLLGSSRETSAAVTSVQAELYRANDIENYDTAALRATVAGGAQVLFYTTHAVANRRGPGCRYEFERGVIELEPESAQFVARFHDGTTRSYGQPNFDRNEKIWQAIDAVRTGEPLACGIRAALPHTICVAAAQESSAIHDFPREMRQSINAESDPMVCVEGLHAALSECYDRGVLPSEHGGLGWARAGTPIQLAEPDPSPRRTPRPVALRA